MAAPSDWFKTQRCRLATPGSEGLLAQLHSAPMSTDGRPAAPDIFIFDQAALQAELLAIRRAFPDLGPNGWMSRKETGAASANHRDPLLTKRFAEQFARSMTYLRYCTRPLRKGESPPKGWVHQALAKRYTGASVQAGAIICGDLALGSVAWYSDADNAISRAYEFPLPLSGNQPVTVALRPSH